MPWSMVDFRGAWGAPASSPRAESKPISLKVPVAVPSAGEFFL